MKKLALLSAALYLSYLSPSETSAEQLTITVDLKNPTYNENVLTTRTGGVIQGQDIRIQAQEIAYTRKSKSHHTIEASGSLMVQYKGRVYVGKKLYFNFTTSTGILEEGRTYSAPWYIYGEKIELNKDGSYHVQQASITTNSSKNKTWDFYAKEVNVLEKDLFEANNVRFRLFQVPTMWLPSFKLNLRKNNNPIFQYITDWDKGQGPRIGVRYQIYSWEAFALYIRADYRLRKGFGGAVETEYYPPGRNTKFVTKNFVATDYLPNDPVKKRRLRFQGEFANTSRSGKTSVKATWDKYTDILMPQDFKTEDFELTTAQKTEFQFRYKEADWLSQIDLLPRVNSFQTLKQNLPALTVSVRPQVLGPTGIISENIFKLAYIDFAYSNQLVTSLPDFNSARFEAHPRLYRPIHMGPFSVTPNVGAIGIIYTDSPSSHSKALGVLQYGIDTGCSFHRKFEHFKHVISPYINWTGLSSPTVRPDEHYIFSIQDGYERINQLTVGISNAIYPRNELLEAAFFKADLYAYAFFADKNQPQVFPKAYLDLSWQFPKLKLGSTNAWNFRHQTFDYTNAHLQWTINPDFAVNLEVRYRSRYWWRKADQNNFILDVSRRERQLLNSPLSDRRITLLTNIFVRLNPFWSCHLQSHHGWYRLTEPPYNEFKVDLYTCLMSNWRLQISYTHTMRDDQVSANIFLIKSEP